MLILTRRIGESLIINEDIKVEILGVHGQQVRVGITAPDDVDIWREEIWKKIQQEETVITPGQTPSPMVESAGAVPGPRIVHKKPRNCS